MVVHTHALAGCAPTPLAHYLKAVGILRLVGEQLDPGARGRWRADDVFELTTRVDAAALRRFFLEDYAPTPLVAPWNGGSGFYSKDNRSAFGPLSTSQGARFAPYRAAIELGERLVAGAEKQPAGAAKLEMLARFRRSVRGPAGDWFDAALVLPGSGDPSYPAMLGTGGNDGRLEFTNNFMQRLGDLFDFVAPENGPRPGADSQLETALFGVSTPAATKGSVGQFLPGGAGGANAADGFEGASLFHAWDFVLMLEGATAFGSSIHRRADLDVDAALASPFAVRGAAAGYGSAAPSDEEKGRGEQWMPLWDQPVSWRELRALLGEGRCQVRGRAAGRALDVPRALARLGVARGIRSFERFGYVERLGQSKLAVPLGRWRVEVSPRIQLVDEVASWIDALRRESRKSHAPESFRRASRRCDEALIACSRADAPPVAWQSLLLALADAERQMIRSPRFTGASRLRPLSGLSSDWLRAADDGRPEIRLAWGLAHQSGSDGGGLRPIRAHFAPLTPNGREFSRHGETLATDLEVVVRDGNPVVDLSAVVRRRLLWFTREGGKALPLDVPEGHGADAASLAAWLDGTVDDSRVMRLARALAAVRVSERSSSSPWDHVGHAGSATLATLGVDAILRTAVRGGIVHLDRHEYSIRPEPAVVARLAAGDLDGAVRAALRRLRASSLRPHLQRVVGSPSLAQRQLAALCFGLRPADRVAALRRVVRPTIETPSPSSTAMPASP